MSILPKSSPLAVEFVPLMRDGGAHDPRMSRASWLARVTLPEQGDELNGQALCGQLRRWLALHPGPCCVLLEGTGMVTARIGFANAFKELDRDCGARMEVVCAIPLPIPRMMVHTVATRARAPWHIFRTRAEAEAHLRGRGYVLAEGGPSWPGPRPEELRPLP